MRVVSLVHQKGGTGKSTLAIALAASLAGAGRRVLLLDTDYQGTCMDWGSRFGEALRVPVRSCVQPGSLDAVAREEPALEWLVVDGAAGLSPMTESILALGGRALVPIRPAWPDVWALPWLAALLGKARRSGRAPEALVVFNQVRDDSWREFLPAVQRLGLPVHPRALPEDAGFGRLFAGQPLHGPLQAQVLDLLPAG